VNIQAYCGGRLKRAIEQVDVTRWGDPDPVYVNGHEIWLWDGQEVEPVVAQAYIVLYLSGVVDSVD
jgi:hypothetical protein